MVASSDAFGNRRVKIAVGDEVHWKTIFGIGFLDTNAVVEEIKNNIAILRIIDDRDNGKIIEKPINILIKNYW